MIKVKGAYYAPALPNAVTVVLPDDTVWMTNLTPFRVVKDSELKRLPAYESPAFRKNVFTAENEILQPVYRQYGFEKVAE